MTDEATHADAIHANGASEHTTAESVTIDKSNVDTVTAQRATIKQSSVRHLDARSAHFDQSSVVNMKAENAVFTQSAATIVKANEVRLVRSNSIVVSGTVNSVEGDLKTVFHFGDATGNVHTIFDRDGALRFGVGLGAAFVALGWLVRKLSGH
jgi:hypothetical protein